MGKIALDIQTLEADWTWSLKAACYSNSATWWTQPPAGIRSGMQERLMMKRKGTACYTEHMLFWRLYSLSDLKHVFCMDLHFFPMAMIQTWALQEDQVRVNPAFSPHGSKQVIPVYSYTETKSPKSFVWCHQSDFGCEELLSKTPPFLCQSTISSSLSEYRLTWKELKIISLLSCSKAFLQQNICR